MAEGAGVEWRMRRGGAVVEAAAAVVVGVGVEAGVGKDNSLEGGQEDNSW